jgi:hypothetical protein
MKRILILALIAVAAWYAWKNWPTLLRRMPGHDAVVQNQSDRTMTRVRLTVGGQTFVKEELPNDQKVTFTFRVDRDSDFELTWEWKEALGERHWRGGLVPKGPMVQRHGFVVDGDGEVTYRAEPK